MNLLECYVTEFVGQPYFLYDFWWQDVKYECYGVIGETSLMHRDKEYFECMVVGFMFLS